MVSIEELQVAIELGNIEWKKHSLERMLERGISRNKIFTVLLNGEIIERYGSDQPFPSVLILGFRDNKPLHVVVAYDSSKRFVYVITVYEPTIELWESNFKVRKKQ